MNNVIEFPLDRRLAQMAIADGFTNYSVFESAEIETEEFLSELLSGMHNSSYDICNENFITDISFLYETMKSLIYKMNDVYHPIQEFSYSLYSPMMCNDSSQMDFDF
jgi:hypothetical protein